jgi:homoserine/homoserine lactone efflux protein
MLSCMTNGGRLGLRNAFIGMLGASTGNLSLVALSALGLGLVISQNDLLFTLVKWTGASYLVFLGVQIMRSSTTGALREATTALDTSKSVWKNSFFIAISNPKALIYFGALFPQFINYQLPLIQQFLVLTLTFLVTDIFWMFVYAMAGKNIMRWLRSPRHQAIFNTISGLVLIAAGIFMALSGKTQ